MTLVGAACTVLHVLRHVVEVKIRPARREQDDLFRMLMAKIYLAGVLVGLVATQGGAATRVGLALLWPLGPLAFVITVAGLLVVAAIAFPMFGVILAATVGVGWWWLR
jgi:ABC-type long-subunit fatty acid transport system fused permease/ATPase subunit